MGGLFSFIMKASLTTAAEIRVVSEILGVSIQRFATPTSVQREGKGRGSIIGDRVEISECDA